MRTLIMVAGLLPVLVIVMAIEWVSEITTGELIAIGISSLIIISTLIGFILKQTAPNRAYKMALFDSSIGKLVSNNDNEVREYRVGRDNLAEVHVRIVAKIGTSVERIRFRLVKGGFLYWRWMAEQPRHCFVERIWDKDWEEEHRINPRRVARGEPLYIQQNEAGILHFGNRGQLKGDIMWYRVLIHVNMDWDGYLEYCGPSGDNRRAYSRRQIILRLIPDRVDSRTE